MCKLRNVFIYWKDYVTWLPNTCVLILNKLILHQFNLLCLKIGIEELLTIAPVRNKTKKHFNSWKKHFNTCYTNYFKFFFKIYILFSLVLDIFTFILAKLSSYIFHVVYLIALDWYIYSSILSRNRGFSFLNYWQHISIIRYILTFNPSSKLFFAWGCERIIASKSSGRLPIRMNSRQQTAD